MTSLIQELADFVVGLKFKDLPKDVVRKAKDCVLDILGVSIVGSTMPWSKLVVDYVKEIGGKEESTIIVFGERTPTINAALANGTMGHSVELDDIHCESVTHPGTVIIPAALAMGEREKINGEEFITSVVLGYEVMTRIGISVSPSHFLKGFHPTKSTGVFGAAAVASKILCFDEKTTANTLSIAGMHSSGLFEFYKCGGEVKRIHGGKAAQDGIISAFLAQRGLTGPMTVLEGDRGFCKAYSDECDLSRITKGLYEEYEISKVAFKVHAACRLLHSSIDAIKTLVETYRIRPEDIDEVSVGTNRAAAKHGMLEPKDIIGAQFSLPFSLALTLVTGRNSLRDYRPEVLRNEKVLKLAKKIKILIDPRVDAEYPQKMGAKVIIKLKDSRIYQEEVMHPKGDIESPLTKAELEGKFKDLASMVLENNIEEIIKKVNSLEKVGDISEILHLLVKK